MAENILHPLDSTNLQFHDVSDDSNSRRAFLERSKLNRTWCAIPDDDVVNTCQTICPTIIVPNFSFPFNTKINLFVRFSSILFSIVTIDISTTVSAAFDYLYMTMFCYCAAFFKYVNQRLENVVNIEGEIAQADELKKIITCHNRAFE